MIADVYKCPECNVNVYLAKGEDCCPLCGGPHRKDMKRKKQNVDLSADASLKDDAQYAHFGHFTKLMDLIYGDKAGLYLMDCWKYAWDATKVDSENLNRLSAFIDNPNKVLSKKRDVPMTNAELQAELERIIYVVLSKCKPPRSSMEAFNNFYSFEKKDPIVRFFVKKDFTRVAAEVCSSYSHMTTVYNFVSVEKDNPTPRTTKGYFTFYKTLPNDRDMRNCFCSVPELAAEIVRRCHTKPSRLSCRLREIGKRWGILSDNSMRGERL